jgi:hypothetical protein
MKLSEALAKMKALFPGESVVANIEAASYDSQQVRYGLYHANGVSPNWVYGPNFEACFAHWPEVSVPAQLAQADADAEVEDAGKADI